MKVVLITLILCAITSQAAAWRITADFEGQEHGDKAVGPGAFSNTTNDKIDTMVYRSGKASAKLDIEKGDEGFGRWGGIIYFPESLKKGDQLWYSVDTYFPESFNINANPFLKFLRVNTMRDGDNNGYNDLYIANTNKPQPIQYIYEGQLTWSYLDTTPLQYDQWESYQVHIIFDDVSVDDGGKGQVRVWKNGLLVSTITSTKTLRYADTVSTRAHLFTYWNNRKPKIGAPKDQFMWADNLILTNETPEGRDAEGNPMIPMTVTGPVPLPPCPTTCDCSIRE